jgi:hypothetical protein
MLPYIRHLRDAAEAVAEQAARLHGLEIGEEWFGPPQSCTKNRIKTRAGSFSWELGIIFD